MSYDIDFRVKVEGVDEWISVGYWDASTTWNLRDMIVKSTELEWKNEENNGLVTDVIPYIELGLERLEADPEYYRQFESPNGWGTIEGCKGFFNRIINDWQEFKIAYPNLVDVATFWIL